LKPDDEVHTSFWILPLSSDEDPALIPSFDEDQATFNDFSSL